MRMFCAVALVVMGNVWAAPQGSFEGTWVFRANGQNILTLTLASAGGVVGGSLLKPAKLTIDQDGDVTEIGPGQISLPVQKWKFIGALLELTINDDRFRMTLEDDSHAKLSLEGMRPWRLERVAEGAVVRLASSLPEPQYAADIAALRTQLHDMVQDEQAARLAFDQARMAAADAKNRSEVLRIFDKYGWVTDSLAGKGAAHDYWLLVQHQTPEIQRRLLPALEKAAKSGNASMTDYVYLYDRVQVGLGRPQHWGTQAQCEKGRPVLSPVDDPGGLDARRKELFLLPIQEYLSMEYLVKFCAKMEK